MSLLNSLGMATFWKIKNPQHLNTGWAQESADSYLPKDGTSELLAGDPGKGARSGYSVKIVSEKFLKSPQILGGEKAGAQVIKNPPK
jgi:hypothetical protein